MAGRPVGSATPPAEMLGTSHSPSPAPAAAPSPPGAGAGAQPDPHPPTPCAAQAVGAGGREYHLTVVRFANGDFVSITEGAPPPAAGVGSMAVSISTPGLPPATTMVIPAKHDGLFLRLVAERVSHLNAGISVVTCSTRDALGPEGARAVMAAVSEMVRRNA